MILVYDFISPVQQINAFALPLKGLKGWGEGDEAGEGRQYPGEV